MIVSKQIYLSLAQWQLSIVPRVSNHYLGPNDDTYTVLPTNALLGNYVYAGDGADTIYGSAVHDSIFGGDKNDTLYGNGAADELHGEEGNDALDGGSDADWMAGGIGDDTYYVDNVGDIVIEKPNEGWDTVVSSVSYTVPDNVEFLWLQGTAAIDANGNAQDNSITGNDERNVINGGDGLDRLYGAGGKDTLVGGDGADVLGGGNGEDELIGGIGRDKLTGGADADLFKFASAAECGLSWMDADQLQDFSSAQGDKIDLSAIDADATLAGDQAFTFIGNNANFSNRAGELRFNIAWVEGDLDGNGAADFFLLVNAPSLAASDFML
jgi:Ca2+-binding RTX toxin-like protein